MNLDLLIINPSSLDDIYQGLSSGIAAIEPSPWVGLLANHVRSKKYSIQVMDCEADAITTTNAAYQIQEINPTLIAIVVYGQQPSASTQNMHGASKLCSAIKQQCPNARILLIGGHISALPEKTLKEEACDYVCEGEGAYTICDLLECLKNSGELKDVRGLWYRVDGIATKAKPSPLIAASELSKEFPGAAWDLLPMHKYRAHNWHCLGHINERQPYASIYTSLGCPFHCSFCCINAPFGGSSFRYWEPEIMIEQFDILAERYHVRNLKISDEMFVLKEAHFMKLCALLKERNHGFNIWAYSRIDTAKPHHMEALKAAGVNWIVLGIESHSKFVRQGVTKGKFNESDIAKTVRNFQQAGINVMGNYIFGLPDDDLESMQQTLDMAIELNCDWANFYSAMAYPGSDLYNIAIKNGWKLPETWIGYSQHAYETLPLPTNKISSGEVLSFRDKAWQIYFENPNYLSYVKQKFGEDSHQHIMDMTKHKLKRKNAWIPNS